MLGISISSLDRYCSAVIHLTFIGLQSYGSFYVKHKKTILFCVLFCGDIDILKSTRGKLLSLVYLSLLKNS